MSTSLTMSRRQRRRQGAAGEEVEARVIAGHDRGEVVPAPPPAEPPDPGASRGPADRDDQSISIVFDMVKTAIDLQFKVTERIDTKVRAYFGFAATVYGVAQAIVLKSDVHDKLGGWAGTVSGLAIAATVALVFALAAAVYALRPVEEQDVSEDNLRALLKRGYTGDARAGSDGVNLLIGQLKRRKITNKSRNDRLTAVIVIAAVAALIAFLEVASAVEAVT